MNDVPMRIQTSSLSLHILILTGSNVFGPMSCTTVALPVIAVSVEHAETGEPLDDPVIVAKDCFFADSAPTEVASGEPLKVELASERPGTYTVRAEKSGFVDWIREDVTATEGRCHVNTVQLHAHLVPESS